MQRTTPLRALAVAIALAAQSASAAVHVSPTGQGQVLLFPYYTVNAQNGTLLSIANHNGEVKALRVRFREAMNGRAVLDFNLYLGPYASWRGALHSTDESGPARLVTNDTACTVPAIPAGGVPFRNEFYNGSRDDDGPDTLDRTREGFVEVIEMGVVVDDGDVEGPRHPLPGAPGNRTGVDTVVEHSGRRFAYDATQAGGEPIDCSSLREAWDSGVWSRTPGVDIDEPSGGLSGAIVIVDVEEGVSYSQSAETLDGFFTVADSAALHQPPASAVPNLASARTRAEGPVEASVAGETLRWNPGTPNAVSSVLMRGQVFNEFSSVETLLAASEWVLTFPTRQLHLEGEPGGVLARRPFADGVDDSPEDLSIPGNVNDISVFDPQGACEEISVGFQHSNGEWITPPQGGWPGYPWPEPEENRLPKPCWQTNVMAWNQKAAVAAGATEVFGARRIAGNFDVYDDFLDVSSVVENGRIRMTLGDDRNFMIDDPGSAAGTVRDRLFGLPAIGFQAARFVNANARPGVLASYALLLPHVWTVERDAVTVTDELAPGGIVPVPEQ